MYLQRDAHLPQTGQLNNATENALNSMLQRNNCQPREPPITMVRDRPQSWPP